MFKKLLALVLCVILASPSYATVYVKRFPTDTAVEVCIPSDTNSNCGTGGGGGSGNVGIGTVNFMPVYIGVSTLGPSNMVHVAGNIGIGSTAPGTTFDVNGDIRTKDGFYVRNYGIGTHSIATTGASAANTAGDSILINAARGLGTGTGGNAILLGADGGQTGVGGIARLQAGNGGNTTGATQNTIAVVASTQKVSTNLNNVTTAAIDTTGATLLVVSGTSFPIGALTDSKSNSWTKLTTYSNGAGSVDTAIYYAANPIVGSGHTFTFTQSSGAPSISVLALSGAKTTSPADGDNGNASFNSVTSVSTGSITPAEDNEIIVTTIGGGPGAGTWSADSGTTNVGYLPTVGGQGYGTGIAYKIQTTAASINPTWSGPSGTGSVAIASFKVAPLSSSGNGGNVKILSGNSGTDSGNAGNITIDSGNKNTGTAGNLLLMTNGQGGNVGLGTLSPGTALDITGRMRQSIAPTLCSAGNYPLGVDGSLNAVSCTAAGGGSSQWITTLGVGIGTYNAVGIGTTSAQAGLVVTNGNVGIGTWTATNAALEIGANGLFRVASTGAVTSVGVTNTSSAITNNNAYTQSGSSANALTGTSTFSAASAIVATGNVGIGTTASQSALSIMSGNVGIGTWAPSSLLQVGTGTGTRFSSTGSLTSINGSTSATLTDQAFALNSSAATITNAGAGGGSTLTLTGGSSSTSAVVLKSTSSASGVGSENIRFTGGNNGGTEFMRVSSNIGIGTTLSNDKLVIINGNVGIGTWIPNGLFQINKPTATPFLVDTAGNVGIGTTLTNGGLSVMNGNVGIGTWAPGAALQIIGSGNVGIGTTIPSAALEVKGGFIVTTSTSTVTKKTGANTACNTTCGNSMCVYAEDTGVIGTLLACTDATADACSCLGP